MAIPIYNNNNGASLNANANFCPLVVGQPPFTQQATGQNSAYLIDLASYYFAGGSTGVATVITFQELGGDGTWRSMASPAPITVANSTNYNGIVNGPLHGLRVNISNNTGNGVAYGELKATVRMA